MRYSSITIFYFNIFWMPHRLPTTSFPWELFSKCLIELYNLCIKLPFNTLWVYDYDKSSAIAICDMIPSCCLTLCCAFFSLPARTE